MLSSQVSDLDTNVDLSGITFIDDTAFVIWKWSWKKEFSFDGDDAEAEEEEDEIVVIPETPPVSASEDDSDEDSVTAVAITHVVTFKCMGCTKQHYYQETLASVAHAQNLGEFVSCKLEPEPENEYDAKAIAIKCQVGLDGTWCTIGYIVREALNEVHEALESNAIISISLNWVKYIIYWNSPGWYAGIDIKRHGQWSQIVVKSQSAKNH